MKDKKKSVLIKNSIVSAPTNNGGGTILNYDFLKKYLDEGNSTIIVDVGDTLLKARIRHMKNALEESKNKNQ